MRWDPARDLAFGFADALDQVEVRWRGRVAAGLLNEEDLVDQDGTGTVYAAGTVCFVQRGRLPALPEQAEITVDGRRAVVRKVLRSRFGAGPSSAARGPAGPGDIESLVLVWRE